MKTLKENSTHKALENKEKNTIEIWTQGFKDEDFELKSEYLYSIPLSHVDDLFAIFERYDEDNRINMAELNEASVQNPN